MNFFVNFNFLFWLLFILASKLFQAQLTDSNLDACWTYTDRFLIKSRNFFLRWRICFAFMTFKHAANSIIIKI
jgi:hypothetical protein